MANWEAAKARNPDSSGRAWRPTLGSRPRPHSGPPVSGEPPPQRPRLDRNPGSAASPRPPQAGHRDRPAGGDPDARRSELAERLKQLQRTDDAVKQAWRNFAFGKTPVDGGSWKSDPYMATLATLETFFRDVLHTVQGDAARSRSRDGWPARRR